MEKILKATYGDEDHPLRIGDIEIPCYVLENGTRVLVRTSTIRALGMSQGTASGQTSNDRLLNFLTGKAINPFVPRELMKMMESPYKFQHRRGIAFGYDARILADICDVVLTARKAKVLRKDQLHIAEQCEILMRGFARVGIIALVDEATGYQEVRDKMALQAILEKFLMKELAAWAKRFPDEFYKELFRLRGWKWSELGNKRPPLVGKYTNDLIYERLAPGLMDELQRVNPKNEKGNRKGKHHQWLTDDVGHPALAQHLYAVIGFMRASSNWGQFHRMVQRAFPKRNTNMLLPYDEDFD